MDGSKSEVGTVDYEDSSLGSADDVTANRSTQQQQQLAQAESILVKRSRLFMLAFLACAAVGCAAATWWFVARSEAREFEIQVSAREQSILFSGRWNVQFD